MPRPGPAYRVRLPGLADIYHPIPLSALPEDERKHRAQLRAELMAQSPTPAIIRGITDVLTRIDDIQDALVTLSLATRFVVPILPGIAPAAKVIAVLADILNLEQFMQQLGLLGGERKGTLYRALSASPRTYSARLRNTIRTSRVNPTVGELLQVLQTTDQLFGVGMSLGAVMGIPADLLSLTLRGGTLEVPAESLLALATLAPIFFSANPYIQLAALATGFGLAALADMGSQPVSIPVPALLQIPEQYAATLNPPASSITTAQYLQTAENALEMTPPLDTLEQELSIEDHFTITLTRYMALAALAPFALAHPDGLLVREKLPLPVRARFPAAVATIAALETSSSRPARAPVLGFPNNPVEIPAAEIPAALRAARAPGPLAWIHKNPDDPRAIAAGQLSRDAMNALALSLEGPGSIEPPSWSSEALAAARRVETGSPRPGPKTE